MSDTGRPRERRVPAYDVREVRTMFAQGRFRATVRVEQHLLKCGRDRRMVQVCAAALRRGSFHKSQELLGHSGVWADVYRPQWAGVRWYIKIVREDGGEYRVLSFCRDGENH